MTKAIVAFFAAAICAVPTSYASWDQRPENRPSLTVEPVAVHTANRMGLTLALKRYPRPGAQPVLLVPGLASNDRIWDSAVAKYSFARFLHAKGFDVWVGNIRHSGTPGFRSETPELPYHWTVDNLAIEDLPALIYTVQESTRKKPFIVGHSLAAWIFEGYLAGMDYEGDFYSSSTLTVGSELARRRQAGIQGVITFAGVYTPWWPHSIRDAFTRPIRSADEFYQSNYELEALAHADPLYELAQPLPALPLSWIGSILDVPLHEIPWVGEKLAEAYRGFQGAVIGTPLLNMFVYSPNADTEVVRQHGYDGLEELGPRLLEQLGNAIRDEEPTSFYHGDRPRDAYRYSSIRKSLRLPMLFVAGNKDRCANSVSIYRNGYEMYQTPDKQYIEIAAGHMDVISGKQALDRVMEPVAQWMLKRQAARK